jgi:hypothetical protein
MGRSGSLFEHHPSSIHTAVHLLMAVVCMTEMEKMAVSLLTFPTATYLSCVLLLFLIYCSILYKVNATGTYTINFPNC